MNHVLLEAFRHSAWATSALLEPFRRVTHEELTDPYGGYAGLLRALNHAIITDAHLAHLLDGTSPPWRWPADETDDIDELEARIGHAARLWEKVLSEPVDAFRIVVMGEDDYEFTVATLLTQALHHGHALRQRVNQGLVDLRVDRPDIQPYAFALQTGRGRTLPGAYPRPAAEAKEP